MGLSFYGIRLGEILIGSSAFVLLLYTSIIPLITKKYFLNNKRLNYLLIILYSSFFVINIFEGVSLINPSVYKVSTYIWSFGALVFGYNFISKINFNIFNHDIVLSFFGLFVIYMYIQLEE